MGAICCKSLPILFWYSLLYFISTAPFGAKLYPAKTLSSVHVSYVHGLKSLSVLWYSWYFDERYTAGIVSDLVQIILLFSISLDGRFLRREMWKDESTPLFLSPSFNLGSWLRVWCVLNIQYSYLLKTKIMIYYL